MVYLYHVSSLEEKASAQVAINLCQENGFKEVAFCLEKPTYGFFIDEDTSSFFLSDPKSLSIWTKMEEAEMKGDNRLYDNLMSSLYPISTKEVERWDAAIDEQCERLTERLPHFIKYDIIARMNRIALEYLSYSRRQEVLFGVPRYFLMDVLTQGDLTESGRLDEKLAKRLVKDQRLTVLQKYRIACVYCMHENISQLWKRLTQEEKHSISGNDNPALSQESHRLVLLWSYQLDGQRELVVTQRNHPLIYAAGQAVHDGNRVALMSCWKRLKEHARQQMIIEMALKSIDTWQSIVHEKGRYSGMKLVVNNLLRTVPQKSFKYLNLPSYYSELMRFFLSEMEAEQQFTFFEEAFERKCCCSILECFLDWPHQDTFLPMIDRLWGIIPKKTYRQCLLILARKYSGNHKEENRYRSRYIDYRSLLRSLWEKTPKEYKQFVFRDIETNGVECRVHEFITDEAKILFPRLLEKSPFQTEDEELFKSVFFDQPQEDRRVIMRSVVGKNICSILTQREMWSFVNWLLEECFPKEEIPSFKKQFLQSDYGFELCCSKLKENRQKFVDDIIDWSFALDAEKTRFKYELIREHNCLCVCKSFLCKGEFTEVERMMNFCLSSDEMKERIKIYFANYTCSALLEKFDPCNVSLWEKMDAILAWSTDTEEKQRDFKKNLFSITAIRSHFQFVFIQQEWKHVERFYKWFDLSPEEIKKLKKDTLFSPHVTMFIVGQLYDYPGSMTEEPLRWCLTSQEMVMELKRIVEEDCNYLVVDEKTKEAKESFDDFLSQLLRDLRKEEVQDKAARNDVFKRGGKTYDDTEDESSSPRKRIK